MSWLVGKHLVILGCGYIGTALAERALREGAKVSALTRNQASGAVLGSLGVSVTIADLAGDDWHRQWPDGADAVVVCIGSGGPSEAEYRRSYVDGIGSAQRWLQGLPNPPAVGIFTSSTSVYPQGEGVVVDEQADTAGTSAHGAILLEAEARWRTAGVSRTCILRLAGIYGPDRHQLLDQIRAGAIGMRGGRQRLNLAHRDDIVSAILAAGGLSTEARGAVYNVSDGAPAPREEVITWLSRRLGKPMPVLADLGRRTGEPVRDRVISNAALQADTGWRPAFPDFRAGYEAILQSGR
jgi:nucleoside-diphosphate-sugar epimerase